MTKQKPFGPMVVLSFSLLFLTTSLYAATDTTIKGTTTNSSQASLEATNSADTSLLFVRNDGNVGIGQASPTAYLHLKAGVATANVGAPLKFTSGTNLTTAEAGAVEYDGKVVYSTPAASSRGVAPSEMFRVLTADTAGADSATAQPWFPSTGSVTLPASTGYFFRGAFMSTRAAGSTSHTTDILFGGTATLTGIGYFVEVKEGDVGTISDSDLTAAQVATATNIKAASTSTTENIMFTVEGTVWIANSGTFIPQFKYSAAPGGAPTVKKGTYFALYPIGSDTAASIGNWS